MRSADLVRMLQEQRLGDGLIAGPVMVRFVTCGEPVGEKGPLTCSSTGSLLASSTSHAQGSQEAQPVRPTPVTAVRSVATALASPDGRDATGAQTSNRSGDHPVQHSYEPASPRPPDSGLDTASDLRPDDRDQGGPIPIRYGEK